MTRLLFALLQRAVAALSAGLVAALTAVVVVVVLVVAGGCDPLTGPDYLGEPVLTLQGDVKSVLSAGQTAGGIQVAIVWVAGSDNSNAALFPVAETTVVDGDFPASFTLAVYHPPEETSLVALQSGGRLGIGFVVALPANAATGDDVDIDGMLGVTNRHAVLYVPSAADVEAVGAFSGILDDAAVGFNVADLAASTPAYETCKTDAVAAIDGCHADCDVTCDPDSAEDPGCDLCRAPCEDLSADLLACDRLVDAVVPTSTPIELVLDPAAVASSAVWSLFNPSGDPGDG